MRNNDGAASSELASGEDIREVVRFAAFLNRADDEAIRIASYPNRAGEAGEDAAYDAVYGADDEDVGGEQ